MVLHINIYALYIILVIVKPLYSYNFLLYTFTLSHNYLLLSVIYLQIQIFGYNSQLYANFSDALNRAQGIVGVSILLQVSLVLAE